MKTAILRFIVPVFVFAACSGPSDSPEKSSLGTIGQASTSNNGAKAKQDAAQGEPEGEGDGKKDGGAQGKDDDGNNDDDGKRDAGHGKCKGVVCRAVDQCHAPGTCDAKTGLCSNPSKPNGTACNDGDRCTQTDTCERGTCTGSNPVVCTAPDPCHVPGTCDPTSGICSNPAASDAGNCSGSCSGIGTWAARAPMATAEAGIAAASINGKLYVMGGQSGASRVYDPIADAWTSLAPMPTARALRGSDAAVVNAKIYVIGGNPPGTCTNVNEMYDPATNSWASRAPMPTPRCHLSIAVLNGLIYAMGGTNTSGSIKYQTVEVYDPASDSWTTAAPMPTGRQDFAADAVAGKLYAVGGWNPGMTPSQLTTTEGYDPATNTWTTVAPMPTGRSGLAIAILNGMLWAVGGLDNTSSYLATVERYDPASNTWTTAPPMPTARGYLAAGTVNHVLYSVGGNNAPVPLATNEAFTPCTASQTWTPTGSMAAPHYSQTWSGAVLNDGRVLVAGGQEANGTSTNGPVCAALGELFDETTGSFAPTGSMVAQRFGFYPVVLADGRVLVAGGQSCTGSWSSYGTYSSAEIYDPSTGSFAPIGNMSTGRWIYTATRLPNGKVLFAGGLDGGSNRLSSAELFDPGTGTFSPTGSMSAPRSDHRATLLPDGTVLITGGAYDSSGCSNSSAETYDPVTETFTLTASMSISRAAHTSTLLANGKVLVASGVPGCYGNLPVTDSEIYDPVARSFVATGNMNEGRQQFTATLLPNGKVLVAGGATASPGSPATASAELYDPASGTFMLTGSMSAPRYDFLAALLPSGRVLVAGGYSPLGSPAEISSAEIFMP